MSKIVGKQGVGSRHITHKSLVQNPAGYLVYTMKPVYSGTEHKLAAIEVA